MMIKGVAPWFPSKTSLVLPSGCATQSMASWVSNWIKHVDAPSIRARMMMQALPCLFEWDKSSKLCLGSGLGAKYQVQVCGWLGNVVQVLHHLCMTIGHKQVIWGVEETLGMAINALLWWRPMAHNTHPTNAYMILWRAWTPYRETKPQNEDPPTFLYKIQCVPSPSSTTIHQCNWENELTSQGTMWALHSGMPFHNGL